MADSRIKILVSFLMIIVLSMMKHWYVPIVISFICILLAAKLDVLKDYTRHLVFPLVLALFIVVIQGFTYGVHKIELGMVSVYSEGIEYGFLIFSRVIASASVLMLLVLTTTESELLESMRYFGVPKNMIEISSFMSRYVKTFMSEGKKLKLAQESRCGFAGGFKNRMQNIASLSGLLVVRAYSRSGEVYRAMLSRAWKPELQYSANYPLNKRDIILGILLSSASFALLGLDRLL